jgi:hypothetical protein
MRTFNENNKCNSSVIIDGVEYKLKSLKPIEGGGMVFTVDEPNKEQECIHFPLQALKALYLMMTSNEEKK